MQIKCTGHDGHGRYYKPSNGYCVAFKKDEFKADTICGSLMPSGLTNRPQMLCDSILGVGCLFEFLILDLNHFSSLLALPPLTIPNTCPTSTPWVLSAIWITSTIPLASCHGPSLDATQCLDYTNGAFEESSGPGCNKQRRLDWRA